jgi:hypothetical protein
MVVVICVPDSAWQSPSHDEFDSTSMARRPGERRIAGDDRRIERLSQCDVHGVVRRDVLAQLLGPDQQVQMGVTVEIEVGEIRNRFGRAIG